MDKEKEPDAIVIAERSPPQLTSLDIVAWAYLKEELTNTKDAQLVKYMREQYSNLVRFVEYID